MKIDVDDVTTKNWEIGKKSQEGVGGGGERDDDEDTFASRREARATAANALVKTHAAPVSEFRREVTRCGYCHEYNVH